MCWTTLPRSAIGKILKRELRDSYLAKAAEGQPADAAIALEGARGGGGAI